MPASEVIGSYHELWNVEQSFRMSKTDLRARPMFHRTRHVIEAHPTIVFTALAVSREVQARTGLPIRNVIRQLRPCAQRPSRSTAPPRPTPPPSPPTSKPSSTPSTAQNSRTKPLSQNRSDTGSRKLCVKPPRMCTPACLPTRWLFRSGGDSPIVGSMRSSVTGGLREQLAATRCGGLDEHRLQVVLDRVLADRHQSGHCAGVDSIGEVAQ